MLSLCFCFLLYKNFPKITDTTKTNPITKMGELSLALEFLLWSMSGNRAESSWASKIVSTSSWLSLNSSKTCASYSSGIWNASYEGNSSLSFSEKMWLGAVHLYSPGYPNLGMGENCFARIYWHCQSSVKQSTSWTWQEIYELSDWFWHCSNWYEKPCLTQSRHELYSATNCWTSSVV